MAKSFLSITLKAIKAAEKDRIRKANSAVKEENARQRENARQAKAHEANLKKWAAVSEKELKAAHIASQIAEVGRLNSQINEVFEDLERVLEATISVDDFIDLEALRKSEHTTPFDKPKLEVPLVRPKLPKLPSEPQYTEPDKPTGFFGKKRKIEEAKQQAQRTYEAAKTSWAKNVEGIRAKFKTEIETYEKAEASRLSDLTREKARFIKELQEHNQSIDKFISDLSYGDAAAVQEYISLVVGNSVYPDHFNISHDFAFDAETAELRMKVSIPEPKDFPSIKSYKYIKASDEIREVALTKTEFNAKYCSVIYQVAIRSLHEVFEADRRGLIGSISLEVGVIGSDPATGRVSFLPFVGVGAERETFLEFDLAGLVPLATLKHLGAAISKDPANLVAADVGGVRKS